jgi:hypothetical protein
VFSVIVGILGADRILAAVGSKVGVQLHHGGARRDRIRSVDLDFVIVLRARERDGCGEHNEAKQNPFQTAALSVRNQE